MRPPVVHHTTTGAGGGRCAGGAAAAVAPVAPPRSTMEGAANTGAWHWTTQHTAPSDARKRRTHPSCPPMTIASWLVPCVSHHVAGEMCPAAPDTPAQGDENTGFGVATTHMRAPVGAIEAWVRRASWHSKWCRASTKHSTATHRWYTTGSTPRRLRNRQPADSLQPNKGTQTQVQVTSLTMLWPPVDDHLPLAQTSCGPCRCGWCAAACERRLLPRRPTTAPRCARRSSPQRCVALGEVERALRRRCHQPGYMKPSRIHTSLRVRRRPLLHR